MGRLALLACMVDLPEPGLRVKARVSTHNDIADRNTADATLWWFYGTKFLQNIFEHLNYKILRFEEQKHDPSHTDPNCQYHNIVLEVN